ncbi:MAG: proton-conducting transporter membrane subunit [Lachnospiraceae bacterium]|nr:proton-conducting transporter membrane subunit [Lachnospiraceae bacterium]
MDFVCNLPFFCIVLALASGVVSSVLKPKAAKAVSIILVSLSCICSLLVLLYTIRTGTSFTYMMGHFPAPFGNEIRAGVLEGVMASFFSVIMLLALLGGEKYLKVDIEEPKQNLYFVLINLLLSSLLALVYTNDLFTAYVFVEINTISAGGLIMIRSNGHSMLAATKYMIMSLLGSGLLLIGITLQYDLTGHLLMSNIQESIAVLAANGEYTVPLTVIIGLISVGIAIKSALFPFHAWLADAYGYSTASSAAILSSLVSKAYIFLLIKIMYRVIGTTVFWDSKITNVFFVLGVAGMLFGSISAIKEHDMRRMIAFSSVAQIGYIYMGLGFGTELGMVAAVFHILSHAATKSMLFVACRGLSEVSGNKKDFSDLKGSGFRNKIAGVAFSVGAFSMVGVPLFAGFISKLYLTSAALETVSIKMVVAVIILAVSTILNALYFVRAVISIYTPRNEHYRDASFRPGVTFSIGMVCFIAINFILGLASHPLIVAIEQGLRMFS